MDLKGWLQILTNEEAGKVHNLLIKWLSEITKQKTKKSVAHASS